ncbi:MAG TPA: 1-deoxy-D-xylulose-5-phosphate reductoisomerase [Deltaproteobacteria bacterium]|nr:1-deoxy-D-xylulose-5-phosphate reductoisomerase [Deltaproteobacteria bacterium]
MKKIALLGSTGSIGVSALDVIGNNPDKFKIVALAAGQNINLIKEQVEKYRPQIVALKERKDASDLETQFKNKYKVRIVYGEDGIKEIAARKDTDTVISAISGAAGLMPTITAIEAGKDIALANKETMVVAGDIVNKKAKKSGSKIIPIDSEHSAIFQCLQGRRRSELKRIILTASGGPFLKFKKNQLKSVRPQQALKHPKWKMGRKISIDSATMMNKGLEVIEAMWLFGTKINNIEILIHPQSIVHSMVEFTDGSILAQMGIPDMRIPIAYALSYPERISNNLPSLNLSKAGKLEFYLPNLDKFPCLKIAYEAGLAGKTTPAVLNAANEVAVEAYLNNMIKFTDISILIENVLSMHKPLRNHTLEDIVQVDSWARMQAKKNIERKKYC